MGTQREVVSAVLRAVTGVARITCQNRLVRMALGQAFVEPNVEQSDRVGLNGAWKEVRDIQQRVW